MKVLTSNHRRNHVALLLSGLSGRPVVAHHGIQRSGTNYLLMCLKSLRIPIANAVDPERDQPKHKHFRWQADKASIPPFIRHQYHNAVQGASLAQLHAITGYPDRTRHVVVQKDRTAWLRSIANWGLRCEWFADKAEALASVPALGADYDAYYGFWNALEEASPDRVAVIPFEGMRADSRLLPRELERLGVPFSEASYQWEFEVLHASPVDRGVQITAEEISA